jgi:Arc/MetJ-type ribon-helix-helix transcriptional regulator
MQKTTIYLPRDLRWFLREEAAKTGKSQAELIREGVETLRQSKPVELPRTIGIVQDGTLDAEHAKDWIREHMIEDLENKHGHA